MDDKELLERASSEIKHLREQNKLTGARLDVFDSIMLIFGTQPAYRGQGMMHPDIVYELDKAIERLKKDELEGRIAEGAERD